MPAARATALLTAQFSGEPRSNDLLALVDLSVSAAGGGGSGLRIDCKQAAASASASCLVSLARIASGLQLSLPLAAALTSVSCKVASASLRVTAGDTALALNADQVH